MKGRKKMMSKDVSVSSIFKTARIWAILSVVSAHISYPGTMSFVIHSRFGTIGVVVFLVIAGYYFRPIKFCTFKHLLCKKFCSLCVPWIFAGILTWCYKAVLTPDYRTLGMLLRWLIGNGSYFYYMSIILLCFVLFYKTSNLFLWLAILTNILSVFLTAFGYLSPFINFFGITNYLNLFNWVGFFAIGMLMQNLKEDYIVRFFIKYRFLFIGLATVGFALLVVFDEFPADYFSYVAIPCELLGALAVFSLSTFTLTKLTFFHFISDYSFSIYLFHMIFIGLLDGIMSKIAITRLLSPVVVILCAYCVLFLGRWVFEKVKFGNVYGLLIGTKR